MVAGRLTPRAQEWAARLSVLLLLLALALALVATGRPGGGAFTLQASMPEAGGWQPDHLTVAGGEPLRLQLTSDDVVHSFAVAGQESEAIDVEPGRVTDVSLTFDEPGTYTFYCTRWCGPNHWRMRGTIEVTGEAKNAAAEPAQPPLYVQLGLDVDAPHPAPAAPQQAPSAERGAEIAAQIPAALQTEKTYMTQSPAQVWLALRDRPELSHLEDRTLWDAVAFIWRQNTTPEALALGEALYSQNCAACHGESGQGDGVFAAAGRDEAGEMRGQAIEAPTDFTDTALLGASNALLQGKILRGGMGTGMPAWGPIFGEEELQALMDYLWTFHFPREEGR